MTRGERPSSVPTLTEEERLWQQGRLLVAGIDEAGRGALAGPVVAGVVILPPNSTYSGVWSHVRDSKLLSPHEREELAGAVQAFAAAWAVGAAAPQEIDEMGIAPATRLAMSRAISSLTSPPDYLLLDWVRLPRLNLPQESFTKGDRRIVSIAAASILAKTHRDTLLIQLHEQFPQYDFASNKGYGTRSHRAAIDRNGPCPQHRHSFSPIRKDPSFNLQSTIENR